MRMQRRDKKHPLLSSISFQFPSSTFRLHSFHIFLDLIHSSSISLFFLSFSLPFPWRVSSISSNVWKNTIQLRSLHLAIQTTSTGHQNSAKHGLYLVLVICGLQSLVMYWLTRHLVNLNNGSWKKSFVKILSIDLWPFIVSWKRLKSTFVSKWYTRRIQLNSLFFFFDSILSSSSLPQFNSIISLFDPLKWSSIQICHISHFMHSKAININE